MFLAPSSSRAVDPYLQTLLLRVSLSRLGGKHRQLARQAGDSASSSASSMATFAFSTMTPPQGATFVFGSWVCIANVLGSFDGHLTNLPTLKATSSESPNKLARSGDHGVMLLPDFAKEIEMKLKTTRVPLGLRLISNRNPLGLGLVLCNPSLVCAIHRLFTNR